MTDKDLYGGLIRLHILHHAAEKPVFGLGIIEELQRHGYELSAGTVYPMLHGLEKKGYLTSRHERTGRRRPRLQRLRCCCCQSPWYSGSLPFLRTCLGRDSVGAARQSTLCSSFPPHIGGR